MQKILYYKKNSASILTKILLAYLFILVTYSTSFAQLLLSPLIEDNERESTQAPATSNSANARLVSTQASSLDTLELPFFDDFTGVFNPIDSAKSFGSSPAHQVTVYDEALNQYPDTTAIILSTTDTANTLLVSSFRKFCFIKKVAPNQFLLYTDKNLTINHTLTKDTIVKSKIFWHLSQNYLYTTPDLTRWKDNGNTFINNRYPVQPPSFNVATFDGLKSDGIPYNTVNVLAVGFADDLTSKPINLKPYTVADNIYLSFYWQHTGVGDVPETNDYLQIDFKDSLGNWNAIRTISGDTIYMNRFKIDAVQVSNPIYFYKGFQFRFRSHGRLSGPFDIWNLDYIYLNRNRSLADSAFFDLAIGNGSVSFLQNYSSMPYGQFFANKANEIGPLYYNKVFHDRNSIPGKSYIMTSVCEITEKENTLNLSINSNQAINSTFPPFIFIRPDTCTTTFPGLNNVGKPLYVKHSYVMKLSDTVFTYFSENNRLTTGTILWDYYAYDDGSPEWGVGGNQIGARVANQFSTTILDTLNAIDIYFTRNRGPNMAGRSILLSVWDENFNLVSQNVVQIKYGGFVRYKLTNPVVIDAGKTFYVGYQQNFVDLLSVGYDKNYDRSSKVYFNLGGNSWTAYSSQPGHTTGSMMIRAVFDKRQILITPIEKEQVEFTNEIVVFPNPADQILHLNGKILSATVVDLTGKIMLTENFDLMQPEKTFSTLPLPNGFYLLLLDDGKNTTTKKIIIQHD